MVADGGRPGWGDRGDRGDRGLDNRNDQGDGDGKGGGGKPGKGGPRSTSNKGGKGGNRNGNYDQYDRYDNRGDRDRDRQRQRSTDRGSKDDNKNTQKDDKKSEADKKTAPGEKKCYEQEGQFDQQFFDDLGKPANPNPASWVNIPNHMKQLSGKNKDKFVYNVFLGNDGANFPTGDVQDRQFAHAYCLEIKPRTTLDFFNNYDGEKHCMACWVRTGRFIKHSIEVCESKPNLAVCTACRGGFHPDKLYKTCKAEKDAANNQQSSSSSSSSTNGGGQKRSRDDDNDSGGTGSSSSSNSSTSTSSTSTKKQNHR